MALEAVVLSQLQGTTTSRFGCGAMAGGAWNGMFGGVEGAREMGGGAGAGAGWDAGDGCSSSSMMLHGLFQELDHVPAAGAPLGGEHRGSAGGAGQEAPAAAVAGRRKRRRTRAVKNREEVESQRMTHIAVERNRRKQMNEYLAVLRSLMPPSYAQRGDQASVVGGAINFVKELEQLLQSLEARKRSRQCPAAAAGGVGVSDGDASPFANFFTFPQYSMSAAVAAAAPADTTDRDGAEGEESAGWKPSAVADVEATMVESHANLRVLSRRRPRQLLRLVVGLQGHRLTVLHLNMTSAGHMVLYSFSLKVEDDCQLTTVDEIATAAHQIIERVQEEQGCSVD
ncbi:hypothetical protein ACP70R_006997 [Stipagrostis hirtigluma subsp. patula]